MLVKGFENYHMQYLLQELGEVDSGGQRQGRGRRANEFLSKVNAVSRQFEADAVSLAQMHWKIKACEKMLAEQRKFKLDIISKA